MGMIAGYVLVLFTWEFINCKLHLFTKLISETHPISGMNLTTGTKLEVSYWANRAGTLVAVQMPLIVALAGKNNLISCEYT
jgi:ferric-chelate reductase